MGSLLTAQGADGRNTGDVQPVAESVSGSPFTSGAASAPTPEMTGLAIIVVTGNSVHVRFDKGAAVAATANDFLIPVDTIFRVPVDGDIMSFIQETAAGTIYIELAREVTV